MLHDNAIQATYNERESGYGQKLLRSYPVNSGDVLIVLSAGDADQVSENVLKSL